jgi:hypothetical protein
MVFAKRRALLVGFVGVVVAGFVAVACGSFSSSDVQATDAGSTTDGPVTRPDASSPTVIDAGDAGSVGDAGVIVCDPSLPFNAPVLMEGVNSMNNETYLRLTADGLTAYFESDREMPDAAAGPAYAILSATRVTTDLAFGAIADVLPSTVGNNLNSATVTGDNDTLFYVSLANGGQYALMALSRASPMGPFSAAMPLPPSVSPSTSSDVSVYVLPAGDTLYFSSDRSSATLPHLFFSRANNGTFQPPTALAELNGTGPQQNNPVVTADELTIYFSSGGDIWKAVRSNKADAFGPSALVTELSSSTTDGPSFLTADGCDFYLFSDRPGGIGGLDLYRATRK